MGSTPHLMGALGDPEANQIHAIRDDHHVCGGKEKKGITIASYFFFKGKTVASYLCRHFCNNIRKFLVYVAYVNSITL